MRSDPTQLLIDALATYRTTRLATTDHIFDSPREQLSNKNPHVSYVLHCDYCASVYAAALIPFLPRQLRYLLALSGATSLIATLLER